MCSTNNLSNECYLEKHSHMPEYVPEEVTKRCMFLLGIEYSKTSDELYEELQERK